MPGALPPSMYSVEARLLIPQTGLRIAATLLRLTRADGGEQPLHPSAFRLRQAELSDMANA